MHAHLDAHDEPLKPLSPRQRDLLNAITEALDEEGRAPTIRDLANSLGIASTNGINDHLTALIRKGYITLEPGISRGVRPLRYADASPFLTRKELLAEIALLRERLARAAPLDAATHRR